MARISLIFFVLLLYTLIINCDATATAVSNFCSGKSYDSTVQHKVKYLFNNLASQASQTNFYSSSVSDELGKVYGLFQCRGDLHLCTDCIQDAMLKFLTGGCENSSEAVAWYYECVLYYSNRSVFPLDNTAPFALVWSRFYVPDSNQFTRLLNGTIEKLIAHVTTSKSSRHFGVQEVNSTLYALAQCIPEISGSECKDCLQLAAAKMLQCCSAREYAMVSHPSCLLRYDKYQFYDIETRYSGKRHLKLSQTAAMAGFLTAGVLVVIISGICFGILWRKGNKSKTVDIDDIVTVESLKFSFNHIKAATNDFSADNKLGRGGFGEVYKGKLRTGEIVAVKRLSQNSDQGISEFKNEVLLIVKLQHRNLVRLLGFCLTKEEKILVYEFLCNSSLDQFLYDEVKRASLDWTTRFKIILGIARGLQYLHQDSRLKIIHRDLKSSNILLDEEMNPKISDFGIAKLVAMDRLEDDTSRIVGTYGYMAPEYAMAGQFSEKSDVYSFGVMVLETISGQRNHVLKQDQREEGLLHRAWRLWKEGRTDEEFVDKLLNGSFSEVEMNIAHHIGLLCVQEEAARRPTMENIITALNGHSITLPMPTEPHIFTIANVEDLTCTKYFSLEVEDGGIHQTGKMIMPEI